MTHNIVDVTVEELGAQIRKLAHKARAGYFGGCPLPGPVDCTRRVHDGKGGGRQGLEAVKRLQTFDDERREL